MAPRSQTLGHLSFSLCCMLSVKRYEGGRKVKNACARTRPGDGTESEGLRRHGHAIERRRLGGACLHVSHRQEVMRNHTQARCSRRKDNECRALQVATGCGGDGMLDPESCRMANSSDRGASAEWTGS